MLLLVILLPLMMMMMVMMMIMMVICASWSSIVYNTVNCDAKNGTFGTLQLLQNHEVDVVFGPLCSTGRLQTAQPYIIIIIYCTCNV